MNRVLPLLLVIAALTAAGCDAAGSGAAGPASGPGGTAGPAPGKAVILVRGVAGGQKQLGFGQPEHGTGLGEVHSQQKLGLALPPG